IMNAKMRIEDGATPRHLPSSILNPRIPYNAAMRRYFPDFENFSAAAKNADIIPVYRQMLADRLTPVSAFEVLGRDPHAFLLESVVGGEQIARYSFIATAPSLVYQVAGGNALIASAGMGGAREFKTADPLADLQELLP